MTSRLATYVCSAVICKSDEQPGWDRCSSDYSMQGDDATGGYDMHACLFIALCLRMTSKQHGIMQRSARRMPACSLTARAAHGRPVWSAGRGLRRRSAAEIAVGRRASTSLFTRAHHVRTTLWKHAMHVQQHTRSVSRECTPRCLITCT
jgi:hypothetical protein